MTTRVAVTIKDTLGFWSDELGSHLFNPNGHAPTNTWVYAVPDSWIVDGTLTSEALERVYERLYGPGWRGGNSDGSRYFVLETAVALLAADDPREAKPLGD